MDKIQLITGTFTMDDGTSHEFGIGRDGGWQQWGGERDQVAKTVDAIEDMAQAAMEYLVSDCDDDDEEGEG